jgi:signal transduction histidine kinase
MTLPEYSTARRILIVDDNPDIHKDFRRILADEADSGALEDMEAKLFGGQEQKPFPALIYDMDSAFQGKEALEKVRISLSAKNPYRLAFVDMRMPPGWDGLETIQHLWKADPEIQIVICTAYSDYSWEEITRTLGRTDRLLILKKPFDSAEVAQLAGALTEKWQLARQAALKASELEMMVVERTRELSESNAQLEWEIAERKRSEEARRLLEEKVQEARKFESLAVLAGGIAHTFNNILMVILGNAELLLLDLPENSGQRNLVEVMRQQALRAAQLSGNMMAYSGHGKLQLEKISLTNLVREMEPVLEATIGQGIMAQYGLAETLPDVLGDSSQLRQVLTQLVTNAVEAIGTNGGTVTISSGAMDRDDPRLRKVFPGSEIPPGKMVFLGVADTGCGMDEDTYKRIFDPFFTTKFPGRGLGLAAVLGIVRGHKGTILVDSKPGEGSVFLVLFPQSAPLPGKEAKPVARAALRGVPGREKCILFVDDEPAVREVGKRMLERAGYRVMIASDGQEAIRLFRERPDEISCVILDLTMPVMDGEQTCQEIRMIRGDVPIIISSGYSEEEVTGRFADQDLGGVLAKPYQSSSLIGMVRRLLGES